LNKKERQATQIKGHKTMAVPTLTYSPETWALAKSRGKKEREEVKFIRIVAGNTSKDQIKNTVLYKRAKYIQFK
jgi:hypothetical protein